MPGRAKLGDWAVLLVIAEVYRPAAGQASPGSGGLDSAAWSLDNRFWQNADWSADAPAHAWVAPDERPRSPNADQAQSPAAPPRGSPRSPPRNTPWDPTRGRA